MPVHRESHRRVSKRDRETWIPADLAAEGGAGAAPGWFWRVAARGRPAAYVLLGGLAGYGFYTTTQSLSGPLVFSIVALAALGALLGIDLAGAQNRRLEAEIERYKDEIDRVARERNRLQSRFLESQKSSRRGPKS